MSNSLPQTSGPRQEGTPQPAPSGGVRSLWRSLDRRGFLGYRAWDFTWRALGHNYGRHFLGRVVLRHPLRSLQGYADFRQVANPARVEQGALCMFPSSTEDFLHKAAAGENGRFMLAIGYCQKKLATETDPAGCPAGRFNHDCALMDGSADDGAAACAACDVRMLSSHALPAGASLYLMTAAQEITRDVLVPALEQSAFRQTLMLLCPMSVQAVLAPMIVCRLPGFVISYNSGFCADHAEWLRADRGDKPKQTGLHPAHASRALQVLDSIARERRALGVRAPAKWRKAGNVYYPEICD